LPLDKFRCNTKQTCDVPNTKLTGFPTAFLLTAERVFRQKGEMNLG
jgi:hypothetical protein